MDQIDPEQQRIIEQAELERKWLVIPMRVMADKRLTLADKVIYGRAFFFDEFFESKERTADILGVSVNQVKISKRKLEALGLIRCVKNDGRGKRYVAMSPQQGRGSNSDPQRIKFCPSENQNLTPENKVENKAEISSSKEEEAHDAPAQESESLKEDEKPTRFGKAEINDILDEWEAATGFQWHGVRQERYAVSNLLRKYGSEATKALVQRVGVARRSDDQFAPQIAKPSHLMGKYEKLTALTLWEERTAKIQAKAAEMGGPDLRKFYSAFEFEDEPANYIADYSDEEKQRRRDFVTELRKKHGFERKEAGNE